MERKKITAADATRYPRLYRDTYWGNFRLDRNADLITPEIVENRNRFAVRWRLRRLVCVVGQYPARGRGEGMLRALPSVPAMPRPGPGPGRWGLTVGGWR